MELITQYLNNKQQQNVQCRSTFSYCITGSRVKLSSTLSVFSAEDAPHVLFMGEIYILFSKKITFSIFGYFDFLFCSIIELSFFFLRLSLAILGLVMPLWWLSSTFLFLLCNISTFEVVLIS